MLGGLWAPPDCAGSLEKLLYRSSADLGGHGSGSKFGTPETFEYVGGQSYRFSFSGMLGVYETVSF